MVTQKPVGDREKVVSKLPAWLRQDLKIRAAELGVDIQDAAAEGIELWRATDETLPAVDTSGAATFSTWLLPGQWDALKATCHERGRIPFVQGLAQSIALWLREHPSPKHRPVTGIPRRKIVCNQKGGVGKTAVAAGIAEAYSEDPSAVVSIESGIVKAATAAGVPRENLDALAEPQQATGMGLRVLLVDYDPQGHLTKQLGLQHLPADGDSLAKHMSGQATNGTIKDLVVTVKEPRFGGRLDVLPACPDSFLLDIMIVSARNRQATLERALEPLESDYDVIVVDCPPSLGVGMDAAIYYGRRRDGEAPGVSGTIIVVLAEDSSADAYAMLIDQIESGKHDWRIEVDYLGLVVNAFDPRDGYIITSSMKSWLELGEGHPPVIAVIDRLKEQREAVRGKVPLLSYAPDCPQANVMRAIAKESL
ncbi:ParA family protein [Streptomyces sp. NPDC006703]|uniref:ParA family protein n=1 Tax=Streptomyces sp. NPDC006703 TaxID=3364759 RepID=UPI0036B703FD